LLAHLAGLGGGSKHDGKAKREERQPAEKNVTFLLAKLME
jgi:hypothetical protein